MKKNILSVLFFVLLISTIFVSGCFDSPKTGPVSSWDKVFLDFVATFENYKDILYDASDKAVADSFVNKYNIQNFQKMVFVAGEDKTIPTKIQEAVIWMMPGDTKTIILTPADLGFDKLYDPSKIVIKDDQVSKLANIQLFDGSITKSDDHISIIKKVEDLWDKYRLTIDSNDLKTYQNVIYTITLLQVGGNKLVIDN